MRIVRFLVSLRDDLYAIRLALESLSRVQARLLHHTERTGSILCTECYADSSCTRASYATSPDWRCPKCGKVLFDPPPLS